MSSAKEWPGRLAQSRKSGCSLPLEAAITVMAAPVAEKLSPLVLLILKGLSANQQASATNVSTVLFPPAETQHKVIRRASLMMTVNLTVLPEGIPLRLTSFGYSHHHTSD